MSTKIQVEWRRNKVLELLSKGNSQTDISNTLQVDLSIISRDGSYLRQQSKQNIRKYIDERLPEEYEKCLVGLIAILRESWDMSQQPDIERRKKVQTLSLAKECYTTKLELLTNATVVKDAITFVSKHLQQHQQQDHGKDKEDKGKIITIDEFETKTILEET